ncbi:MAG TPA: hypothetical protein VNH16_02920 [Burkholderiales bacterium]|nr:hypothetical protein [Burkholderiales bacterium]
MSVRILRAFFIRKILETRFSPGALQESPEAMSERERLEGATEAELEAELTALDHMPMAPMPGLPSS